MLGFSTNSIQFKIWRSQLTTLFVLMILLIIANFTVFQGLRDRLVYEQLEHAIEARNEYDGFDSERDDFLKSDPKSKSKVDNGAWTPHFAINWLDESPTLIVDQFTGEAYMNDARYNIPLMILSNITEDGKDRGKLSLDSSQVHYLTHNMDDGSQMVYFHVSATYSFFRMEYLIVALLLGVMGFFTSALAAKRISRPIKELENFADELARRNWQAEVPSSDTKEITHLTASMDAMKAALQELEVKDRKFLQSTSHDLKTPVMIIKGYAQAIKDGISVQSDDSVAEVLLAESQKLERRITQLLKFNTVGHTLEHEDQRDYIRIDRLLRSLVKRFEVVAPNLDWEIHLDPLEILGDGEALLIAFENLLENQLRYAKSRITIQCTTGSPNIIQIGNDGPFFETQEPDSLFDPYMKETEGNFGLGLAIVKQVITAHQGTVNASNEMLGVKFTITLN